jgi:hypothetical protein
MMAPKEKRAEKSAMTVAKFFARDKATTAQKGRISLFISMLPSTNHWTQPRRC